MKSATIITCTVEVLCPHCGENEPNPDNGADTWTPAEVEQAKGLRRCAACRGEFNLTPRAKVEVR